MFRAILNILHLVYILPIFSNDIPTCLKQTEEFHHTQVTYDINGEHQVVPTVHIALRNQEIHHQKRQCVALDIKTDSAEPVNTYHSKKLSKKNRFFHVYLKDMWHEYSVKRQYHFVVPRVSAQCKCYCKWTPLCGHYYEHDAKYNSPNIVDGRWKDETNYGIYSHGYTCKDSGNSGIVCCNVTVKGDYADKLHAIFLEIGRTHYDVEINVVDEESKGTSPEKSVEFSSATYSVWFGGGSGVMKVLGYGQFQVITAQWGLVHPERPSEIKIIGHLFNEVNETRLRNVGWYKWTAERQFLTANQMEIAKAFKPIVHDCDGDPVDWRFHANGWQGHRDDGVLMQEYYKGFVETAEYNSERKVVYVRHKDKPRILADIDFKVPLERLLVLGNSDFATFDAKYDLRTKELVVGIRDAYGKLTLEVRRHNTTENLLLRTFLVKTLSLLSFSKKFHLEVADDWDGFLRVCLSTVGKSPKTRVCVTSLINGNETQTQAQAYGSNGSPKEKTCRLMTVVCVVVWISVLFFRRVG